MAKVMMGKMTIADASEKSGISVEDLLAKLDELVKAHKTKSSWSPERSIFRMSDSNCRNLSDSTAASFWRGGFSMGTDVVS